MLVIDVKKDFATNGKIGFSMNVSFSVANEFMVLSGISGAGKTTTLRMIAGISNPDSGIIKLNSQVFFDSDKKINLPIQKRRVGFVFQDYALFPHLTAEQNIAYGVKNGNSQSKINKAREMLALFHIEYIKTQFPHEMSGGEQQRVALARALASDPLIVLLDEPLSAVDVETRSRLLDEIEIAQRQINIPFIYVTHNKIEAARFGNNTVVLKDGRVEF